MQKLSAEAFAYEATAGVERGWWVVRATDIGREARVATMVEVEPAARRLYAHHLSLSADDIDVVVLVLRSRPHGVVRNRMRRR